MARQTPLSFEVITELAKVIGDANTGLTHTEIGHILINSNIPDTDANLSKWKRLANAFINWQNKNQCSNNIFAFLMNAMAPVRYMGNHALFDLRRSQLNQRLAFLGLTIQENGKIGKISRAETIRDAVQRADMLKKKLGDRNVHLDVLTFCKAELLENNYFFAVFETTKSVANKIRKISGETTDGALLVDTVFALKNPLIRINDLQSETERSEHLGFANLLKGFFSMFRNTLAHAPKIHWEVNEQDALDIMSLASLFHRRLDAAKK